ncbi:MAG TPA: 2OG-Fe(II) oxygenase [Gammaproteobacteria bacterium]
MSMESQDISQPPQAVQRLPEVIETLLAQGYAVVPDFLSPQQCRALAAECRTLREQGEFHRAGVGRGEMLEVRPAIRSDEIRWLEHDDCGPLQRQYLALMADYQQQLKRGLFLPLVEFECFCAVYPPGSFYKKHLDQFKGVEQRQVTAILYLNDEWQQEDGGQLRIFLNEQSGETLEVLPALGTFVTFLSADYWHEVLPAHRDRLSITGWFKTRPVGNAFPLQ